MNKWKIILLGGLLLTTIACRLLFPDPQATETLVVDTEAHSYENEVFRFTIPEGWQTMGPEMEYYGLGVQEIIAIQSPPAMAPHAFFTVATSPLADGDDLETRFTQAYELAIPEIQEESRQLFEQGALSGYEISYARPWGEPWWQFHDIWLEKDGVIYVLSFQTARNGFDNFTVIFDQILDSFHFMD